jgi:hypothetical protein
MGEGRDHSPTSPNHSFEKEIKWPFYINLIYINKISREHEKIFFLSIVVVQALAQGVPAHEEEAGGLWLASVARLRNFLYLWKTKPGSATTLPLCFQLIARNLPLYVIKR